MGKRPKISLQRAAAVAKELIDCRRAYCGDGDFFKMPDVWNWLCDGDTNWKIRQYASEPSERPKQKAGVMAFDGSVTLTVDERLMEAARKGCALSNFILSHELAHLALDHHARNAVVKNFQLFSGPMGRSNLPPTDEELEANYGAVFFQCGAAIFDNNRSALELAKQACTDVSYVQKAQSAVRVRAFTEEFERLMVRETRVIL